MIKRILREYTLIQQLIGFNGWTSKSRLIILIFSVFLTLYYFTNTAYSQDYIKLINLSKPMKCKILDVNDSLITYQKTNSNLVLKAKVSQLDYILFEDGTGKNYTGKPINQDDIKEAFEYRPPGMDTLIVKNKETEIDYSQLDYSPLEINIKCEPHQLFQITAKQLLTQGFLINQVNSEILLLTTDYTAFSPKFFKEVFAKFLGVRNFEYAVTAMIIPIDINSSKLIIRGKARYTKGKGAVEKLVGGLLKQSRFDYLGEYNEQDQINVIIHKGTDMYKPIEFLANRIKLAAESEN